MGELKIKTKKNLLMLILAFTFVLAIAGTSAAAVSETSNVTTPQVTNDCGSDPIIDGTITVNEYGHVRPLEGATVTANSVSGVILGRATTDASGYYSMNFYSTDTTFDIVASYMGCTSQTKRITVNNGPNYPTDPNKYGTANFELIPKSAIYRSNGNGKQVYIQGQNQDGFAGVLNVRVDGTTYVAFCIDLFTPIYQNDVLLVNGPLPGTAGDLPPEVEWEKVSYILNNYNPSTQNEAAAIQCAIWYFTSVHYGDYNPSAPVGTYYQFMTAPRDGVIRTLWVDDTTIRTRAWNIINQVNAATIPNYPNSVTLTPETTTVANGQTVTVTATVKDKNGNPLSGITVNFQRTAGTLSNSSGTTNANGQVTTTLTLGNNSNSVVTASVTGNYGNLLYDDQYAAVRKQNLVARNVLPLVISDFSTIKTASTANVALTQTANSPVNVGDTVTYTVTATNNGPSTATGILISDIVPAGLSGVTVTPSVGTYYNGIWTIPTLANNAKATLTITGTATAAMAGLTTTNTATRIAQEQYNSRPTTTTASVYTKKADVTITNTANHSTLNVGEDGTFTIRVTNNGPDRANIQITDLLSQLPAGFTAGTPSTGSYNPTTGVWTITNLATGTVNAATLVFSGVIQAAQAGTTIINHATATMTEYPQTVTIPDASIYVKKADVTLSQTGNYQSNVVNFIVTATNNGPDTATNLQITDLIPSGLTGVTVTPSIGTYDSNTGIWTIPQLLNGELATLKIIGDATPQTTIINSATLTDQNEFNSNIGSTIKKLIYVPSADVKINLYTTTGKYDNWDVNNDVTWAIDALNSGPDDAHNVIIKITLPQGLDFKIADTRSNGAYTYDPSTRTITWTINFMPNGGAASLDILTYISKSGNLTMTATKTNQTEHDPNTDNNARSRTLPIPQQVDIQITQTVDNDTMIQTSTGDVVTFTINIQNNGDNATGLTIKDSLPTGLTFQTANTHGTGTYDENTGIWTIGNFNNGQTATLTITALVNIASYIKNTAKLETVDQFDWNFNNNAHTIIINQGDYIKKSDVKINLYTTTGKYDNWDVNNDVTWAIDALNSGPDDAHNVIIKITLPQGLDFKIADTRSNGAYTYDPSTRTITWTINFMPNGGAASLDILTYISKSGNLTMTATKTNQTEHDPNTDNNARSRTLPIPQQVDIQITQTVDNDTMIQTSTGDVVTFTINIQNNGDNATGLTIKDSLPTGLTFQTANTHGTGTYDENTGIWTIGNFNNGQTATLTITALVNSDSEKETIINTVKLESVDQFDWNFNNNSQKTYINVEKGNRLPYTYSFFEKIKKNEALRC